MLTRINLKNFQKHKRLDLSLSMVSTIVGSSDAGKSAVIRALKWVLFNVPSGTTFIRTGVSRASVELEIDGRLITRKRHRSTAENIYLIDGDEYKSFGTSIPEVATTLLNIGRVCIQNQHSPVFWFSKTPGEVSRELNSIVNLGLIDSALKAGAAQVRAAQARETECRERLKKALGKRGKLRWVGKADKDLRALEALAAMAEEKARRALLGSTLLKGVAKAACNARDANKALLGVKEVRDLSERASKAEEGAEILIRHLEQLRRNSSLAEAPLPSTEGLDRIEKVLRAAEEAEGQAERLQGLLNGIRHGREEEERAEASLVTVKEQEAAEGVCPVCGRKM